MIRWLHSCFWPANVSGRSERYSGFEKVRPAFAKQLHHLGQRRVLEAGAEVIKPMPADHSTRGSHYSPILQKKVVTRLLVTLQDTKIGSKLFLTGFNYKHLGGLSSRTWDLSFALKLPSRLGKNSKARA